MYIKTINLLISLFSLIPLSIFALFTRLIKVQSNGRSLRLVFGSIAILNNHYWSKSMKNLGYNSNTFVFSYFKEISKRSDWDYVLSDCYKLVPYRLRVFLAFAESLFKYDVFVLSYRGFFLQKTFLRYFQAQLLRIANKKIIIIPYGSDAFVYGNIRSTSCAHALMISYPLASRQQSSILKDVIYWNKYADAVIPGMMSFDGIGRWDVLAPSSLVLDLDQWTATTRSSYNNGVYSKVVIVHSPNHRGCKGTEYIINAVDQLKNEKLNVELKLLEKVQNHEVRNILRHEADILVEQLIFTGHGLSGLEGMASGIPTIANLEDEAYTLPMRRWSFLNECPLVSATPENITDVLRVLVTNPKLRKELGRAGREYVEKYHGLDSAQYLFENVFDFIYGKKESIINLYHPILGEYPNRSPKIKHPLVNNRIVDKSM
jgi:glycosyltransferase involved in cell wall biosynthesis